MLVLNKQYDGLAGQRTQLSTLSVPDWVVEAK